MHQQAGVRSLKVARSQAESYQEARRLGEQMAASQYTVTQRCQGRTRHCSPPASARPSLRLPGAAER